MRKLYIALALALIVAACGGTDSESAPVAANETEAPAETQAPSEAEAPSETTGDQGSDDSEPPATEAPAATPSFDGPPAPDFMVTLGDGSSFSLSGEQKPVYVVFWAEW